MTAAAKARALRAGWEAADDAAALLEIAVEREVRAELARLGASLIEVTRAVRYAGHEHHTVTLVCGGVPARFAGTGLLAALREMADGAGDRAVRRRLGWS